MSEIEDRRQRAHEAGWGAGTSTPDEFIPDVDVAIEAATQVKITREAIEAAWDAQPVAAQQAAEVDLDDMRRIVAATLAALGFEVIE